MIAHLFLLLALATPPADPVAAALESYRHVMSYRVTLRSTSGDSTEIIRYSFKKPGFVRMDFVKPHNGAILVYDPAKKEARLRPFGFLKPMVLTLDPDSRLITSSRGHRVDASDLGAFLGTVKKLAEQGTCRVLRKEKVGAREALLVEVKGGGGATVADGVHRYLLWLDLRTMLPLRTQSFAGNAKLVEEVVMDDLELNVDLPDSFFAL